MAICGSAQLLVLPAWADGVGRLADATRDAAQRSLDAETSALRIAGAIRKDTADDYVVVDFSVLGALPRHAISTSTVVTDGVLKFEGVLMRDLLDYVGATGSSVRATALNGYEVDIPMRDFLDFDVLLAWSVNGQRLRDDDKGPFWIVYPRDQHVRLQDIRYDYRWVWQLIMLQVS